jgi:hypothetical protein
VVLVAIMIKLIRDGRGWARWLYLAFALLITRDVFQVLGFFQYDHLLTRVLTGLVGLSSLAALALLFLPEANAYFRPEDGSTGLLGSIFRPRIPAAGAARSGVARSGAARLGAQSGTEASVASRPDGEASSAAAAEVASVTEPGDPSMAAGTAGSAGSAGSADAAQPVRPSAPRGKSRQSGQASRNGRR